MASSADKVSRSTAIWVAVITAAGGFATAVATGAIGLLNKKPPVVVQRWLTIEGVELSVDPGLPRIDRVRLVAQVNGVAYAYPTSVNSIWAPVGPGMASERFPLPVGAGDVRVKFFAFGLAADGRVMRYEYRGTAEHTARRLPMRNATQALQFTSSASSGLLVGLTVRYSIE